MRTDDLIATSAWARWRAVLGNTFRAAGTDRISMTAAGCAFYATLALFPAISVLISIYGLILRPVTVERQLAFLSEILPFPAFMLIEARVHHLVHQTSRTLSLNLAVSLLLAFWSSAIGSKSVLSAINIAYNVTARRRFLRFQAVGLGMTLVAVLCGISGLAVLLGLPAVIGFLGLSRHGVALIRAASMTMLIGFFFAALVLLYRYGPSRPRPAFQRIKPGALLATALWLAASEALSWYVARIGSFGATYGPLVAAVGIMLWFYVSAYATLLGAELNAQLEAARPGSIDHRIVMMDAP
ncbi:MAG TPA: YihY/virulence factor BrkB family protein [Rhodopila sp.]|uniref:YihY/virulence factor BrkB family protein n=1 Tax=Rhodopila sp. TaxID=2480087 RepID=UPI002BC2A7AF|nr:YihY/virulence factor BrkB family protein [Rhodopila sp.]HVY13650.1 YihY/virulence factor BrkB family protein [Rhodopila sp.]